MHKKITLIILLNILFCYPTFAFQVENGNIYGYLFGKEKDYSDYNINTVIWGNYPQHGNEKTKKFLIDFDIASNNGVKVCFKVGTRTYYKGFKKKFSNVEDSIVINSSGKKILVKELQEDNYWPCLNSDKFLLYIISIIENNATLGFDCIMIDDALSNYIATMWHGGCYCENCVNKFNQYAKDNFGKNINIRNIHNNFSEKKILDKPYGRDFLKFQILSSRKFISAIRNYFLDKYGVEYTFGGNIDISDPNTLYSTDVVDFFSSEINLFKNEFLQDGDLLIAVKLAELSGKPLTLMGRGKNNFSFFKYKWYNALNFYVAETYALGSFFLAPYKLWAYNDQQNFFFSIYDEEILRTYKFIHENKSLFKDYKPLIDTILFIDHDYFNINKHKLKNVLGMLFKNNIMFKLVDSPDAKFLDTEIKNIFLLNGIVAKENIREFILSYKDRVVLRDLEKIPSIKTIDTKPDLFVTTYQNKETGSILLHVLNQRSIVDRKSLKESEITMKGIKGIVSFCTLFTPESQKSKLKIFQENDKIHFTIPNLNTWGIVQISTK